MHGLSEGELRVIECIREWQAAHDGASPTLREIAAKLGYRSKATVARYFDQLSRKGYLVRMRLPYRARGYALADHVPSGVAEATAGDYALWSDETGRRRIAHRFVRHVATLGKDVSDREAVAMLDALALAGSVT